MWRHACAALTAMVLVCAAADDWPHWRGPTRDGISKESSGWTTGEWLPEQPAWVCKVGIGTSAPLVFRSRVYVVGSETKTDFVRCLNLNDGKEEWSQHYPSPTYGRFHLGEEFQYGGPSATPEIDTGTGLLYTLGTDGDLNCWDTNRKGERVWSLNLTDKYDVKQRPQLTNIYHRDYGYTAAPLIHGNWLIVEIGSTTKGTFVAFDKKTGKEVWRSELMDEAGHTGGLTPMIVQNVPCFVGLTQRHLAVIRLDAGKTGVTLAKEPWVTDGDCNIATPTVVGSSVLVTSSYNQSAMARFDVSLDGMTRAWKKPVHSKVCSPVVHDGAVYYSWMKVYCLDWATGEKKWDGGSFADAGSCVITSDGRVIVYGFNGKLGLVEGVGRSPKEYKELAVRDKIFKTTAWPHVAFASGMVVCRDKAGNLAAFAAPRPAGSQP